jgi:hypothetical protein
VQITRLVKVLHTLPMGLLDRHLVYRTARIGDAIGWNGYPSCCRRALAKPVFFWGVFI